MRERPILFSGPMVRSILAGHKTQTRRVIKPQPRGHIAWKNDRQWIVSGTGEIGDTGLHCPYGEAGGRLWVRESFQFAASLDHLSPGAVADKCLDAGYSTPWAPTQYEADGQRTGSWRGFDTPPVVTEPGKLRPSIHMPRWASRITLEITGVRVERLRDISDDDVIAEGVDNLIAAEAVGKSPLKMGLAATCGFAYLWDKINGPGSWESNPWVWVVEFRRITQ
ncbi:MAG: hypothetical protein WCX93_00295 [Burkholderiaceae bacterium]